MEEYFTNLDIDNRGMFLRPFSFKGRIRRLEYGISMIIWLILLLGTTFIMEYSDEPLLIILSLGLYIGGLWFWLAQATKRAHDRNTPGPYIIIPFYIYYLLFAPSNKGVNDYGNSPKDPKASGNDYNTVTEDFNSE